jgi:ABC-2 type transport system permease protein
MKNIFTIIGFEYKGFARSKAFKATTIFIVAVILILSFIPRFADIFSGGEDGKERKEDAIVLLGGEAASDVVYREIFSKKTLEETFTDTKWTVWDEDGMSPDGLKAAVQKGDANYAIYFDGGAQYGFYAPGNQLMVYAAIPGIDAFVTSALRMTAIMALPEETQTVARDISALAASADIVEVGGNAENNFWLGYVVMFFLYFVLIAYGSMVSTSVVTEKTSKAMELLITAAKPLHLMTGKVLGVGMAALTQVITVIAAVALGIAANLQAWKAFQPTVFDFLTGANVTATLVILLVVFFLLGFFLYAFLLAALASTVSKPEEASTVSTIPIILLVAAFLLGMGALAGILDKTLVSVLSYIPLFTPFVMTARYCLSDVSTAGLVIGILVLLAGTVFVAWLAAKVYRTGVMMYGQKPGLRTLWKVLRG